MSRPIISRLVARLWIVVSLVYAQAVDYTQYVNPFIGGAGPYPGLAFGGGDIFVGGAVPFGAVRMGIDTYEDNVTFSTTNGGWTPQGHVTAFSMMHVSGTGGYPKYGIIPQMPLTSIDAPVNILDNTTYWQDRVGNDTAKVGYYKTSLENGVSAELSASRHAGIIQYNFPATEKHILVDLSHYLPSENGGDSVQVYLGGNIDVQTSNATYTGWAEYGGGWNEGAPFRVYFCGEFDTPPTTVQTFRGRNTDPMQRYHTYANGGTQQAVLGGASSQQSGPLNDRIGAVFTWNPSSTSSIRSRVGVSFMSSDKACAYKNSEIASWNVNDTVAKAVQEWNNDVLSKIQVDTGPSANQTNLALLYSSLYFMHLMPTDRTGENPLWDSGEPYFDDFYTLWDIFRCTTSLFHLLQPRRYEGIIRALIDIFRYEGYMPDGRSGDWNGLVQGGSNSDNVLADAYVKGLKRGVNWTDGYAAMVKNAEIVPYNTYGLTDPSASVKEGRGALTDWLNLGYVSADQNTRAISRTIEYSLNDFALSVVAKGEAPQDVAKYLNRSANWQNSWSHDVVHKNFTGFMAPRLANGSFNLTDYNPALCGGCEWLDISYEAVPFEYSFTVPHDMQTLISFMGGPDEFERRLDYILQPNTSEQDLSANGAGITSLLNIGNEPDFATMYEYSYLNKQYKSVQASRSLANQYFHDDLYGVPGNSDSGALNSWLIWQMLGLYPVVTTPVYLLVSPWFGDINMTVNGNRTLRIISHGLDPESYYVQSTKVNGQSWDKNWLNHEDVMSNGGTIEFFVGANMTSWETGDVPPSPGHVVK